jgi:hypothetical protein
MYFIFFSPVLIEQDLVHSQKYIYNKQKWEISFYCCFYVLIIIFPRNLGILRSSLYLVKCSHFYKRMQWNSANCMKYFPFRSTFGFVSLQSFYILSKSMHKTRLKIPKGVTRSCKLMNDKKYIGQKIKKGKKAHIWWRYVSL